MRTHRRGNDQERLVGEASLILENNVLMNRFLEAIGLEKYKTYRIYRRRFEGEGVGVMAETQSFRRVLIVADQSADWMVAGLRQLDRLALSVDEFAVGEQGDCTCSRLHFLAAGPRSIPAMGAPNHDRMTKVAFTTDLDGEPFDLVLNTRLFLYRKAVRQLVEGVEFLLVPRSRTPSTRGGVFGQSYFRLVEALPALAGRSVGIHRRWGTDRPDRDRDSCAAAASPRMVLFPAI